MTNQPKKEINPVVAIAIIFVVVGGFVWYLMENVVKTPLVRGVEDSAEQSRIAKCETQKAFKTNPMDEDCKK